MTSHVFGKDRNPKWFISEYLPVDSLEALGILPNLTPARLVFNMCLESNIRAWVLKKLGFFRSPRRFIIVKVIQTSNEHEIYPLHRKHEKKIRTSNEHKMKHNRGQVDRQLPEGKRMGADFQCFWKGHTIRSTCELSNKHTLEFTTPNPPKTHVTPLKAHQASPRYAANSWTNQCTSPHPCGCRYNRHLAPGS